MKFGVPKETVAGERRVALVPDTVAKVTKDGHTVVVESGAGVAAGFPDDAYRAAGATLGDAWATEIVCKVQKPSAAEVGKLRDGTVMIGLLQAATEAELLQQLAQRRVTAFSLELLPRITRAQSMDVLSSQATAAGYKAVLLAAETVPKFFPMLVTAAGTLSPARVLVLGAGVAGLQAIATARRLGAIVSAFDVRAAVKEQVESLGAKFLMMEEKMEGEGTGGYAKELSADQHQRELDFLAKSVKDADVVITTAAIPGKRAPVLVTRAAVDAMRPGSVIVDIAAETGGNCELTQAGTPVVHRGVTILGPVNLPATLPQHASQMYSRNVATFIGSITKDGALRLDFADEITKATCVTHDGKVLRV
ncbi:MAG TPA: Re/Si-specific NAD(P)(+) transhydrogenase subunit alpha [Gemmatimonadales bacterium]|nr:Re/Si-specific NAD(P)(+) transhydrogenase subunit alpha [Gemmatimonadales bacterium]